MKKSLKCCAAAAALLLIVLLVFVHQLPAPGFSAGRPLPPGKVKPQLINPVDTALLLAPDGSLWAWGGEWYRLTNVFPQPGLFEVPHRIGLDSDWSQVAAGERHTLALKTDGSLWAWGVNQFGQVGQTNLTQHYGTPTRIGTETNWTQICACGDSSLALKNDGSLWAWAWNNQGQTGDGTTNNRSVPTKIGHDCDWRVVATDGGTTFAIKSNGTLWRWGLRDVKPVSVDVLPTEIDSGTNWLAIAASDFIRVALKTDGTLWVKANFSTLYGAVVFTNATSNFTQIGQDNDWAEVYAGSLSFFARKRDGSWWGCGDAFIGQLGLGTNKTISASPQRLPFAFDAWAFSTGPRFGTTLMLGKDGNLWTWGTRMGVEKPSATRLKIDSTVLIPLVKRFPSLRPLLLKSGPDSAPHLLWKLPSEVRRSLGTGPNSAGD